MRRTVKFTRFTYVVNQIDDEGKISGTVHSVLVRETNEQKALKMAVKQVGLFVPIKTEVVEKTFVLDDEIFFQYAKEVVDENLDSVEE